MNMNMSEELRKMVDILKFAQVPPSTVVLRIQSHIENRIASPHDLIIYLSKTFQSNLSPLQMRAVLQLISISLNVITESPSPNSSETYPEVLLYLLGVAAFLTQEMYKNPDLDTTENMRTCMRTIQSLCSSRPLAYLILRRYESPEFWKSVKEKCTILDKQVKLIRNHSIETYLNVQYFCQPIFHTILYIENHRRYITQPPKIKPSGPWNMDIKPDDVTTTTDATSTSKSDVPQSLSSSSSSTLNKSQSDNTKPSGSASQQAANPKQKIVPLISSRTLKKALPAEASILKHSKVEESILITRWNEFSQIVYDDSSWFSLDALIYSTIFSTSFNLYSLFEVAELFETLRKSRDVPYFNFFSQIWCTSLRYLKAFEDKILEHNMILSFVLGKVPAILSIIMAKVDETAYTSSSIHEKDSDFGQYNQVELSIAITSQFTDLNIPPNLYLNKVILSCSQHFYVSVTDSNIKKYLVSFENLKKLSLKYPTLIINFNQIPSCPNITSLIEAINKNSHIIITDAELQLIQEDLFRGGSSSGNSLPLCHAIYKSFCQLNHMKPFIGRFIFGIFITENIPLDLLVNVSYTFNVSGTQLTSLLSYIPDVKFFLKSLVSKCEMTGSQISDNRIFTPLFLITWHILQIIKSYDETLHYDICHTVISQYPSFNMWYSSYHPCKILEPKNANEILRVIVMEGPDSLYQYPFSQWDILNSLNYIVQEIANAILFPKKENIALVKLAVNLGYKFPYAFIPVVHIFLRTFCQQAASDPAYKSVLPELISDLARIKLSEEWSIAVFAQLSTTMDPMVKSMSQSIASLYSHQILNELLSLFKDEYKITFSSTTTNNDRFDYFLSNLFDSVLSSPTFDIKKNLNLNESITKYASQLSSTAFCTEVLQEFIFRVNENINGRMLLTNLCFASQLATHILLIGGPNVISTFMLISTQNVLPIMLSPLTAMSYAHLSGLLLSYGLVTIRPHVNYMKNFTTFKTNVDFNISSILESIEQLSLRFSSKDLKDSITSSAINLNLIEIAQPTPQPDIAVANLYLVSTYIPILHAVCPTILSPTIQMRFARVFLHFDQNILNLFLFRFEEKEQRELYINALKTDTK
eukprot:TRINITY_DN8642_c0_g1_i1.p2 TRINITY_DN8642_c0_g1~~TRINITY_DN8642_c0_g1_i1.p2  ORF type:complete len:1097 (-),score=215.85 TRINITY_DN8642_c0_g1_i1:17-3307(-)